MGCLWSGTSRMQLQSISRLFKICLLADQRYSIGSSPYHLFPNWALFPVSSAHYTRWSGPGMGWFGLCLPRFGVVLVPILLLQLPWLVAVGLTGLDDWGSGGYCSTAHYSADNRDGSAGGTAAHFEDGSSVLVLLVAARYPGTLVAYTAAASLVLFGRDCETLYRL